MCPRQQRRARGRPGVPRKGAPGAGPCCHWASVSERPSARITAPPAKPTQAPQGRPPESGASRRWVHSRASTLARASDDTVSAVPSDIASTATTPLPN